MSEFRMVSPLLDHMTVVRTETDSAGHEHIILKRENTEDRFVLKLLSVPESQSKAQALILSGAYADEKAVQDYYSRVVDEIRAELEQEKKLAEDGHFVALEGYQVEKKQNGEIGYDIYILCPLCVPLSSILADRTITNLRAINMGIDLCDALAACREDGYLFGNLTPDTIYLLPSGKFVLGDLGLVALEDLKFSCIPEEYVGSYAAPELSDISAGVNQTVDLYALGMVLYRVYNANHVPFEDESTPEAMADKLRKTGKPMPTPIYADYELAGIIQKACSFKIDDRYQTPEELKQALTLYMQRNELADSLVIPPIVASDEPIVPAETAEPAEEPVRMTDVEQLDENFRKNFAPENAPSAEAPVPEQPKSAEQSKSAEQPQEAEQPEQRETDDIDDLIASVNAVVGPAPAVESAPAPADDSLTLKMEQPSDDYVDDDEEEEDDEEDEDDEPPRKRRRVGLICTLAALLLAIGGAVYFILTWYLVNITQINIVQMRPTSLTVQLSTNDPLNRFVLTCTDQYGSTYEPTRSGEQFTFSGLTANTEYTISVSGAAYHKLLNAGAYTIKASTGEATKITELTARRGDAEGEVLVKVAYEGPAPADWYLTYVNDAEGATPSQPFEFQGDSYLVTGLEMNHSYTFTLSASEEAYLDGETSVTYELVPVVEVTDLKIDSVVDDGVNLSWTVGENVPAEWNVVCTANGEEILNAIATTNSCKLPIQDFTVENTVSILAKGMDDPATIVIPANPILVKNLKAEMNRDGNLEITWDAPIGTPEGGWRIYYNTVGSVHDPYLPQSDGEPIMGTSQVLSGLLPNTEYEISLVALPEDGTTQIFGDSKITVKTDEAAAFSDYNVDGDDATLTLYAEPDGFADNADNANIDKLTDDYLREDNVFSKSDNIVLLLELARLNDSDDEVQITYALRDKESGYIVNDTPLSNVVWDDLWSWGRNVSIVPLPRANGSKISAVGSYTLEVYINGKPLASVDFTIK